MQNFYEYILYSGGIHINTHKIVYEHLDFQAESKVLVLQWQDKSRGIFLLQSKCRSN